jgi:hypothetical protein
MPALSAPVCPPPGRRLGGRPPGPSLCRDLGRLDDLAPVVQLFAGELAEIGHAFAMGILKPGKNIKFKEIHVVIPSNKNYNFQNALFKKGYAVNTTKSGRRFIYMKPPEGKKRPVLLFMKNTMPKTTTYKEGEKFVAISELQNTSNNVKNMKALVRIIQNLQNNVN